MFSLSLLNKILDDNGVPVDENNDRLKRLMKEEGNIEILLLTNTRLYKRMFKYGYKSIVFDKLNEIKRKLECKCRSNKCLKAVLYNLILVIEEVRCLKCGKYIDYNYPFSNDRVYDLFKAIVCKYIKYKGDKDAYTINLIFRLNYSYYPHVLSIM